MCDTAFNENYDYNLLYYDNCIYKCGDSGNNILQVNVYDIRKKCYLNYLTILEYQVMLIDKIFKNKLNEENTRLILLFHQKQYAACIIGLDDFYISK